jgi:hypothetical protein
MKDVPVQTLRIAISTISLIERREEAHRVESLVASFAVDITAKGNGPLLYGDAIRAWVGDALGCHPALERLQALVHRLVRLRKDGCPNQQTSQNWQENQMFHRILIQGERASSSMEGYYFQLLIEINSKLNITKIYELFTRCGGMNKSCKVYASLAQVSDV